MNLYMVELFVSDFPLAFEWYHQGLGFPLELLDDVHAFALFQLPGGGRVALKESGESRTARLHLQVEHLDNTLKNLKTKGIHHWGDVKTSPEGYRRAILKDPDGNEWVLFEWVQPSTSLLPSSP